MKRTADADHAWTLQRLVPLGAGLLDDDEAARVHAHLAACADCAERHRLLTEAVADPEPDGHIPARLLATWPTASARLHGLERRMVEHHLQRCLECRRDLELLGHATALSPVIVSNSPSSRPRTVPWRRFDPTRWLLGSWASVATAAAAMLAVMLARQPELVTVVMTEPPQPPVAVEVVDPPAPRRAPRLALTAIVTPTGAMRGGPADAAEIERYPLPLPEQTLGLRISADVFQYPDATPARVSVRAPSGEAFFSSSTDLATLKATKLVNLDPGDEKLPPGRYTLTIVLDPPDPAPADSQAVHFVLYDPAQK